MVIAGLGSTAKLAGYSIIGGLLSVYLGTAGKDTNLSYREWTWIWRQGEGKGEGKGEGEEIEYSGVSFN